MFLPFNKLPRIPRFTNFEPFRRMLAQLYEFITSRLLSGTSYVDLTSNQNITTPIYTDSFVLGSFVPLTDESQVPNYPTSTYEITATTGTGVTISGTHTFVEGMYVAYITASTAITGLTANRTYYVKAVSGQNITLSKRFQGADVATSGTPSAATHYLRLSFPIPEVDETTFLPYDNNFPSDVTTTTSGTTAGIQGALVYGGLNQTGKSTLYYNDGASYKAVKLGWPGGQGIFNEGQTFAQRHTGWLHGMGSYKLLINQSNIKLQFDWMEVVEPGSLQKDIVQSQKLTSEEPYNVALTRTDPGLNSIDSSIWETATAYWIYLIYNPSTGIYGLLASKSFNGPNLGAATANDGSPFTHYQRIGWTVTDDQGNFIPSLQIDRRFKFIGDPYVSTTATHALATTLKVSIMSAAITSGNTYPNPAFISHYDIKLRVTAKAAADNTQFGIDVNAAAAYFALPFCQLTKIISGSPYPEHIVEQVIALCGQYTTHYLSITNAAATSVSASVLFMGFKFNEDLWI
jgi:hypothetical protein